MSYCLHDHMPVLGTSNTALSCLPRDAECRSHCVFFFFFPGNRSIIYNSERGIESQNLSPHRFEAAILREIVPHKGLSCLHFLELVFPQFDPGYLAESESAHQHWIKTIVCLNNGKEPFPKFHAADILLQIPGPVRDPWATQDFSPSNRHMRSRKPIIAL